MSSSIKKLLVSQPTPAVKERAPFYEYSNKYNVEIDYHPLIRVEGIAHKDFRAQRIDILSHSVVIFTSRTTIDSFFALSEASRITIPEGMKYICQTEAVALYLQKYIIYRKRKISFGDGTFPSLIELIVKNKGEKFLLTLTEPHKPQLPEALTKLGLNFTEAILALTVSNDMSGININDYDLVALYSPSDVKALIESCDPAALPNVAVFGRATLEAATEAGLHVKANAPTPEAPSMTKAIELLTEHLDHGDKVCDVIVEEDSAHEEFLRTQQSKLCRKSRVVRK